MFNKYSAVIVSIVVLAIITIKPLDRTPLESTSYYKNTLKKFNDDSPNDISGDTIKVGWAKKSLLGVLGSCWGWLGEVLEGSWGGSWRLLEALGEVLERFLGGLGGSWGGLGAVLEGLGGVLGSSWTARAKKVQQGGGRRIFYRFWGRLLGGFGRGVGAKMERRE